MQAFAMGTSRSSTVEIAYHTPGCGWKRKSFKSEIAAERFVEKLDDDVEVRWAATSSKDQKGARAMIAEQSWWS